MSQGSGRPEGAAWVTPYLAVKDVAATIDFYTRAFGFTKRFAMPGPDGKVVHAEMTWNEGVIMMGVEGAHGSHCLSPATSGTPSPVSIYVYCDDVDAHFARATEAGATTIVAPVDQFWGDRMCCVSDPDGYWWHFATNTGKMGAPPSDWGKDCAEKEAAAAV